MLKKVLRHFFQKVKKSFPTLILILLGSFSWSLTMIKSGLNYPFGFGFWGANGHDGIWHLALSQSLSKGSFAMPVFAREALKNYHIGFDLILALLHRVTFVPIVNLYFQILPPVFALTIGLLTYKFVLKWTVSKKLAFWSTFFVYFGGGLGFLLAKGESTFWSQAAISTLINPPLALSLILLLLGLIILLDLEKKFDFKNFVLAILIFGVLFEIKAYAGVLALGALFVSGVYLHLFKKNSSFLKVFVSSLILSLILYFPLNRNSAGLITFSPFWFLETMMGLPDRIGWEKFYMAMLSYKSGHIYPKFILTYGFAFCVFILGNFGTRIIFLFRKIKIDWLNIFFYSIIAAGILIPVLFLQKGTPWNTIQFFYYSLFFSAIIAGTVLSEIKNKLIVFIVVVLTLPVTFLTLRDVYIPSRPPAMVSNDEISALSFLSEQPDGIVLVRPFDDFSAKAAENNPPRPLYLYTSTAYVSAFSGKQTFLEDEMNLDIMGYDWRQRRDKVLSWFEEDNTEIKKDFLRSNGIGYIYWIKDGASPLDLGKLSLSNIFENDLVTIYRVD